MTAPMAKHFGAYLRRVCQDLKKGRNATPEIIYVRLACGIPAYSGIVEEFFMNGVELAQMLRNLFDSDKYFEFN